LIFSDISWDGGELMKIKVTEPILDYQDKPIPETSGTISIANLPDVQTPEEALDWFEKREDLIKTAKTDLTWRVIIDIALNSVAKGEVSLPSEKRNHAYQITKKIYEQNEPDLTVEERAFILERIGKMYPSPLINGRAKEIFEEKKEENPKVEEN